MTNGFVGTATSAYVESDDGVLYLQGFNASSRTVSIFTIAVGVSRGSFTVAIINRASEPETF